MWTVRLLEDVDFVVGEVDVERCHGVGKVMLFGRSHDGSGDDRVFSTQARGDLGHRLTFACQCSGEAIAPGRGWLVSCPASASSACSRVAAQLARRSSASWDGEAGSAL